MPGSKRRRIQDPNTGIIEDLISSFCLQLTVKLFTLEGVKKRGDDYDEVKRAIGSQMVEQACSLFPQIRDKILYTEIGGSTLPPPFGS
jgi:hypothetical protein